MTFHFLNKRLHLYTALFLLLFFFRFGISSISLNHHTWFDKLYEGKPKWTKRFEITYERSVPDNTDLRRTAAQILADMNLEGRFEIWRDGDRITIHRDDLWSMIRLTYFVDQKRLVAEDRLFRWDEFLMKFHWICGYEQDSFVSDAWAFMTDIVCVGLIIWVVTGIYLWWKMRETRFWGAIALAGGIISFVIFILAL